MYEVKHYGIKFPFTAASEERTFVDLNRTKGENVASELMHLIFTPKGQRLRKPDFGSSLIQFIFNPNDSQTWGDIVTEIKDMVQMHIPDCDLSDIEVAEGDDGMTLFAKIRYSVMEENGAREQYEVITNL